MFNRYDLKTHSNMSVDLQETKLQLSGPKTFGTLLTKEKLLKICSKRKEEKKTVSENDPINGGEAATKLLEKFLKSSNKKKHPLYNVKIFIVFENFQRKFKIFCNGNTGDTKIDI